MMAPSCFGLPKSRRLRSSTDYNSAMEGATRISFSAFLVLARKSNNTEGRLGMVVSRKVGNAVIRNLVKRRIREVFRLELKQLVDGNDVVVIARSSAAKLNAEQMKPMLRAAVKSVCDRNNVNARSVPH